MADKHYFFKFGVGKIFNVFKRSLLRLHLFDEKCSENSNIVKNYYYLKYLF